MGKYVVTKNWNPNCKRGNWIISAASCIEAHEKLSKKVVFGTQYDRGHIVQIGDDWLVARQDNCKKIMIESIKYIISPTLTVT